MTRVSRRLEVRAAGPADWPVIAALFGTNGACGGCWCQYWHRRGGRDWEEHHGEPNRRALRREVKSRRFHAVLAFRDGEPVGWCRLGPREDFARLGRSRVLGSDAGPGSWVVVCFFIPARFRHHGVATALLRGAVALARQREARCLEGHPVASSRGEGAEVPAAFAWTGVPALFRRAAFRDVTLPGATRPLFRRAFRR